MAVEASLPRRRDVEGRASPRRRWSGSGRFRVAAEVPDESEAIQAGHPEIAEYEIRLDGDQPRERFLPPGAVADDPEDAS